MIYGANGYTGELIAREAKKRGLTPILAGRSASKVELLSRELGLERRSFGLEGPAEVDAGLEGVGLVLHCAGPFSQTALPILEGCLRNGSHYRRAKDALTSLTDSMAHSSLPEVRTLRNTLVRWRREVLGYFACRLANARTEGYNGKTKLVIRRAYGYRSFKNYRLRLLSACA
jgi:hypothetical protein